MSNIKQRAAARSKDSTAGEYSFRLSFFINNDLEYIVSSRKPDLCLEILQIRTLRKGRRKSFSLLLLLFFSSQLPLISYDMFLFHFTRLGNAARAAA